jgi:hypothetical protein
MLYTSLAEIQSFDPCSEGWRDILRGQGKTCADDVQFPMTDALNSNSIADVLWLIGKRKVEIQIAVRFARMCADSVAHYKNADADAAADEAANAAYANDAYADAGAAAYAANYAANYAAAATHAAANYVTAAANYQKQRELNKQFLIQCITEYQPEK